MKTEKEIDAFLCGLDLYKEPPRPLRWPEGPKLLFYTTCSENGIYFTVRHSPPSLEMKEYLVSWEDVKILFKIKESKDFFTALENFHVKEEEKLAFCIDCGCITQKSLNSVDTLCPYCEEDLESY